jgi:hypothetical protein
MACSQSHPFIPMATCSAIGHTAHDLLFARPALGTQRRHRFAGAAGVPQAGVTPLAPGRGRLEQLSATAGRLSSGFSLRRMNRMRPLGAMI